jgi:hypothetical protein
MEQLALVTSGVFVLCLCLPVHSHFVYRLTNHLFVLHMSSSFRINNRVPTWTVTFKNEPCVVDLTRDQVLVASKLFEDTVHSKESQLTDDSGSVPSLTSCPNADDTNVIG